MKWFKNNLFCRDSRQQWFNALLNMQTVVQQAKHSNWSYFQTRNSYLDMYLSLTFKVQYIEGMQISKGREHYFKISIVSRKCQFNFWLILCFEGYEIPKMLQT